MTEQEILKQLEENTTALREMRELVNKTAHYVKWLQVFDILKVIIILIPLILAYFYLPQVFSELLNTYSGGVLNTTINK